MRQVAQRLGRIERSIAESDAAALAIIDGAGRTEQEIISAAAELRRTGVRGNIIILDR